MEPAPRRGALVRRLAGPPRPRRRAWRAATRTARRPAARSRPGRGALRRPRGARARARAVVAAARVRGPGPRRARPRRRRPRPRRPARRRPSRWRARTARLLDALLDGRTRGPVFLADRRPGPGPAPPPRRTGARTRVGRGCPTSGPSTCSPRPPGEKRRCACCAGGSDARSHSANHLSTTMVSFDPCSGPSSRGSPSGPRCRWLREENPVPDGVATGEVPPRLLGARVVEHDDGGGPCCFCAIPCVPPPIPHSVAVVTPRETTKFSGATRRAAPERPRPSPLDGGGGVRISVPRRGTTPPVDPERRSRACSPV